jgi:hypothetical protein
LAASQVRELAGGTMREDAPVHVFVECIHVDLAQLAGKRRPREIGNETR